MIKQNIYQTCGVCYQKNELTYKSVLLSVSIFTEYSDGSTSEDISIHNYKI